MARSKGKNEAEKIEKKLREIEKGKYSATPADVQKLKDRLEELQTHKVMLVKSFRSRCKGPNIQSIPKKLL